MPATYTLISSNVLSSSAASVTFSSIPATYTDLVIRWSTRDTQTNTDRRVTITLNSDTSALYSYTLIYGTGASAGSANQGTANNLAVDGGSTASGATANTFSNAELYLPNYTSTVSKPLSVFTVPETNAATFGVTGMTANAMLYRNTSAISSITLAASVNFVSTSSFYLYGISNA
tara:strand:- start:29 stop:553 length:525 start_codon:yes stop_codon:yes gene_type:complete